MTTDKTPSQIGTTAPKECYCPQCGRYLVCKEHNFEYHPRAASLPVQTRPPAPYGYWEGTRVPRTEPVEQAAPPRPLNTCQECGIDNPVWFAPSEVWNKVFPDRTGFICPNCFLKKAEPLFSDVTGWEIRPERLNEQEEITNQSATSTQGESKNPQSLLSPQSLTATSERSEDSRETLAAIEQARPHPPRLKDEMGIPLCQSHDVMGIQCEGHERHDSQHFRATDTNNVFWTDKPFAAAEPAPERTPPQTNDPTAPALTYEQEIHALLYKGVTFGRDLLGYLAAQAKQESGDAKKLTEKCIAFVDEDVERFRALIPEALMRRDARAVAVPEPRPGLRAHDVGVSDFDKD